MRGLSFPGRYVAARRRRSRAGATGAAAHAAPGAKGPKGGDVRDQPTFAKKWQGEKHCYAKGIVVWYRNEGVRDNNTFFHPGQGEILPVDSHPDRIMTPDGKFLWSGRWQAWDAPFSLDRQQITLTQAGVGSKTYTADPVTTFWDSSTKAYYRDNLKDNSVMTAGSGVRLRVLDANADRSVYTVQVDKK